MPPALTADYLFEYAEKRLKRPMTDAELRIDVIGARDDLRIAKEKLAAAIEVEKRRVIEVRTRGLVGQLQPTDAMLHCMIDVYEAGQKHARKELGQIGVTAKDYAARGSRSVPARIAALVRRRLTPMLGGITLRLDEEFATWSLGEVAQGLIVDRLAERVPGAVDAASRLVSPSFAGGLDDVFSAAQDAIAGWQYTAVMDDYTCDDCESHDGEEFATWDEIQAVLPDGGPNPDCYGGERCRCRPVPTGAADTPE